VLGAELSESLVKLPQGRVFGLMTEPQDLSSLRTVREQYLGGQTGEYASIQNVKKELNYSNSVFCKYEWPVIHVTNKPIEEIASEILAIKRRIDNQDNVRKKNRRAQN